MFNSLLFGLLVAGAVFGVVATAGFCVAVARVRSSVVTAIAVSLAVLGLAGWLTFWAWLASPTLGRVTVAVLLLVAVGTVVRTVRRDPDVRHALASMAPGLVMVLGLALVTVGLISLWGFHRELFDFARSRFSHYLPVDNEIPQLLADRMVAGENPSDAVAGWQSSDRPTLQTGFLLMAHTVTSLVGLQRSAAGLSAGIAAQLAWVPAVAALLTALGVRRRGVLAGVAFTAMTGTVLVNTVFTWPKLLSAAYVLLALAIVMEAHRERARLGLARFALLGVLFALGMLAHSAAVFAAPIIALALLLHVRSLSPRGVATAAVAAAGTYLPWLLYQRFVDPGGNRILIWHLAEVHEPQHSDVLRHVVDAYSTAGWHAVLENKWANLTKPFGGAPWAGLSIDGIDPHARRAVEFLTYSGAIGAGWIAVLLLLGTLAVSIVRKQSRNAAATHIALLLAFSGVSLVVWAMVLFGPATTYVHHGSHVPILLALAAPLAWTVDRFPRTGALVGGFGLLLCLVAYVPYFHLTAPLSARAVAVAALGVVCAVVAFLLPTGSRTAPAARTPDAAPRVDADLPSPRPPSLAPLQVRAPRIPDPDQEHARAGEFERV